MNNEMVDKINEVRENLYNGIKKHEIAMFLSEDFKKVLYSCLENVFKDIDFAIENPETEEFEINAKEEHILVLLTELEKIIVFRPITEEFKTYANLLLQCFYNHNKNVLKSEKLQDSILVSQRVLKSLITMGETLNILKTLIDHVELNLLKERDPLYKGITDEYIKVLKS